MTDGCLYAESKDQTVKPEKVVGSIPTIVPGNRGGVIQRKNIRQGISSGFDSHLNPRRFC